MNSLFHIYLDYNEMTGSLPELLFNGGIGNGRLEQLFISHNKFGGEFPGKFEIKDHLVNLEINDNSFTSMSEKICDLMIWKKGEITHFQADCNICICKKAPDDVWCGEGHCFNP